MPLTARGPALYTLIFVVAVALVAAFVILIPETENNEIAELRRTAEQGDAKALYNLGYMYYKGERVSQDYTEALKWFRRAAEQNFADAQYNLGYMYYNGKGVTQDFSKALEWYQRAADQGDAGAQYNLGYMYYNGKGIPQDFC